MIALSVVIVGLPATTTPAWADTTFTVNSTADPGTGGCDTTECTLREAITAANNTAGTDTIEFDISGPGVHEIAPTSALPIITDPVNINGETQNPTTPAGTPDIELNGAGAGAGSNGLVISTTGSTVQGLVINRFSGAGVVIFGASASGNQVQGNYIGTSRDGARPAGAPDLGNSNGVLVQQSSNNTVGGTTAATRNVVSDNNIFGIFISSANGNMVQGNYVGTDKDGTRPSGGEDLGNGFGVGVSGSSGNTIGGTASGAGNVLSDNNNQGVFIGGGSSGNSVQSNTIGAKADGTGDLGNSADGVAVDSGAFGNTIGGTEAGAGNLISGNDQHGVEVFDSGSKRNSILSNSIHSNTQLGIGLGDGGVTPNDAGDSDPGPNDLQNFPELDKVTNSGSTTTVEGKLNSISGTTFTVQFFSNPDKDPSGYGEGKTFLGEKDVTTNANGDVNFTFTTTTSASPGEFVTATATDKTANDTSEFSAAVEVVAAVSKPPTKPSHRKHRHHGHHHGGKGKKGGHRGGGGVSQG